MQIDIKEVEKITNALHTIEGWDVEHLNFWESAKGQQKATIRLGKTSETA